MAEICIFDQIGHVHVIDFIIKNQTEERRVSEASFLIYHICKCS